MYNIVDCTDSTVQEAMKACMDDINNAFKKYVSYAKVEGKSTDYLKEKYWLEVTSEINSDRRTR